MSAAFPCSRAAPVLFLARLSFWDKLAKPRRRIADLARLSLAAAEAGKPHRCDAERPVQALMAPSRPPIFQNPRSSVFLMSATKLCWVCSFDGDRHHGN